ncbi:MAG: methyltransferase domain-containing protein, partial [Betaproteobacteria bacterium]|nr:methyltransferase domain-containing protein [Betaproteobacteria bacterium]
MSPGPLLPEAAVDGGADPWADWLLRGRGGGSAEYESRIEARVGRFVERVLDALEPEAPACLLDFGCGSGALGLRALRRWPLAQVVFADPSEALLRIAGERARALGAQARFRLLALDARTPGAGALHELADSSVDAVATRSALAYVADKPAMLTEFRRVLRP